MIAIILLKLITVEGGEFEAAKAGVSPAFLHTEIEMPLEEEAEPRFPLSDEERLLVQAAVMAEARGETLEGQMMVAQCILDGAERNEWDVKTSISRYRIATSSLEPSESVIEAVSRVFDLGERVIEERADLWYAPAITYSGWHEKQQYVTTIGNHKFFWCNRNMSK